MQPPIQRNRHEHVQAPFKRSKVCMGSSGHWIHMLGLLAPLVIGEVIKQPEKRWRAVRISALVTAAASEMFWRQRVRERDREEGRRDCERNEDGVRER